MIINFGYPDTGELNSTNPYLVSRLSFANDYAEFKLRAYQNPLDEKDTAYNKMLWDYVDEGMKFFDWMRASN